MSIMYEYQGECEQATERLQGEDYARAQIGIIVATALARYESGQVDAYYDTIREALAYADGMGFGDIIGELLAGIALLGDKEV